MDSSILIGDPESAMITHDRHILGDHYYRNKMYEKALLAINPSLKINSESKWVLHLLAARIYRKQGKLHEYEQSVNALLFSVPNGKFKSVSEVKAFIENE